MSHIYLYEDCSWDVVFEVSPHTDMLTKYAVKLSSYIFLYALYGDGDLNIVTPYNGWVFPLHDFAI